VQHILWCLQREGLKERGIFDGIAEQLSRNLCDVTGVPFNEPKPRKPLKQPIDSDLPAEELKTAYLRNTPYDAFLSTPVPLRMTQEERFGHMHVVGGTGAGKTTLLERLILFDIKDETRPSIVVVDSQGDLIGKLSRLAHRRDDVILINPRDIAFPPALNVFDLNRDRLDEYDEATREQVVAGVIETFQYLFAGLIGADLTAKQDVFFKYVARLMLALPESGVWENGRLQYRNATILDMVALMEDPSPYLDAIDSMPPIPRSFLKDALLKNAKGQDNKTFTQTRDQIRYRLHAIIENPTLARLFTSPRTRVDLFEELNQGSIILVDTSKDFLKGASAHFGRIFISLVLQAVLERAALPASSRRPTFLFVDEAAEYFDENIDDLLTQARKQKVGCVFAHQYLEQCTGALRASFAANTGIKFAAGVSMADARALAPDLRTTPEFILRQPRLHFAAHIRNVTSAAVSVPVIVGALEGEDQMTADEFARFIERNRDRVSYYPRESDPPSVHREDDPEVSDTWK
jgi:hypothetical protein